MTAVTATSIERSATALPLWAIYVVLTVLVGVAMLMSLVFGYRIYSLNDVATALFASDGSEASTVVAGLRLPRAVLAPIVGAALGVAGVLVQTLARNRIASPDTLGLNAGASVSVVVASAVFGVSTLAGLSLAAALGALCASLLVFGIAAGAGGLSPIRIVLVGVTIAGLGNAIVYVFLSINEAQLQQLLFWLAGAFVDRPMELAVNGAPIVAVGFVLALLLSRALDALQADESTAASLGVPLFLIRGASFVVVSMLTGAAVSMAGPVNFIGLVVPHAARRLVGLSHRRLIPAAALIGASFATFADVVARFVIYPVEAPVGAITGVVGALVLLVLLMRRAA